MNLEREVFVWCAHHKFLFCRNTQPVSELPDSFKQVNTRHNFSHNFTERGMSWKGLKFI